MNWSIETDEDAEKRQRSGAINGRYQVCHPAEGLIEAADTLADALDIGDRYATRKLHDGSPYCLTPYEVEVYDRMARRGRPRTWRRQPLCNQYVKGDRLTETARWLCIEVRQ